METIKSGKLVASLATPEFKAYFVENILPYLCEIEKMRKRNINLIILIFVLNILICIPIMLNVADITPSSPDGVPVLAIIMLLIMSPGLIIPLALRENYKKKMKASIYAKLLSWYGNFLHTIGGDIAGIGSELQNLCIFKYHKNISINDCFYGEYNGLKVSIEELNITYNMGDGKKQTRVDDIFRGLMITTDMNKNFDCHAIILEDKGVFNPDEFYGLQRVALEDIEFEKRYEMYSNDQVEARYIMTPSFMTRMTRLPRDKKIMAAFKDQKAYIFMKCNNMFEIPFLKPATDFKYYQSVLAELADILSIIDSLKLEQDIGL